jgi:hypothetical protein
MSGVTTIVLAADKMIVAVYCGDRNARESSGATLL